MARILRFVAIAVFVLAPAVSLADQPLFVTWPTDTPESPEIPDTVAPGMFYTYLVRVRDREAHNPTIALSESAPDMSIGAVSFNNDCAGDPGEVFCTWRATVSWMPGFSHEGQSYSVTLVATDVGDASATQTYVLRVDDLPEPPQAFDDLATTDEDRAVVIDVLANDIDPDTPAAALSVSIHVDPTHGTSQVNDVDGTLTYTPSAEYYGTDSFKYQVSDGEAVATASVHIDVSPVNDAPFWVSPTPSGTLTVTDGESLAAIFVADDIDSHEIFYAAAGLPPTADLDGDTGELGWTPAFDEDGDWSVVVSATDTLETITQELTLRAVFTDADADGLPDIWESAHGLSSANIDSDSDTISDADEVGSLDAPSDSDADGVLDALAQDADDDGVLDTDEAGDADLATPPINTDGDALPDFQDPDSDDDTVEDGNDNCRLVKNADQNDVDSDGEGDVCEDDTDGDGMPDPLDVCPMEAGPGTADGCPVDEQKKATSEGCQCTAAALPSWGLAGLMFALLPSTRRRFVR